MLQRVAYTIFGLMLLVFGAQARAQNLDVIMRCSSTVYPASTDPVVPCENKNACYCRVYIANQGADVSNVDFTFHAPELATVALTDPAWDPDGDTSVDGMNLVIRPSPVQGNEWDTNNWTTDRRVLRRVPVAITRPRSWEPPAGYLVRPPSTTPTVYGVVSQGLRRLTLAAGSTSQFDVSFNVASAYSTTPQTSSFTMTTTINGVEVSPPQTQVVSTLRNSPTPFRVFNYAGITLAPNPTVRGRFEFDVSGVADIANIFRGSETTIYLPYWNGSAIVADAGYDFGNPSHALVVDPNTLQALAITASGWGNETDPDQFSVALDATSSPDLAVPDGAYNTNKLLFYVPNTNRVIYRSGFLGAYWRVSLDWSARLAAGYEALPAPDATVPLFGCAAAYEAVDSRQCTTGTFRWIAVPQLEPGHFWYTETNSRPADDTGDGVWPHWASVENGALRNDGILQTFIRANLNVLSNLAPLEDVSIVTQIPGSQAGPFGDVSEGRDFDLVSIKVAEPPGYVAGDNPYVVWVSDAVGDWTHDEDLRLRGLIAADDPSWVACVSGSGTTQALCNAAALAGTGAGFGMADVTHVRITVGDMVQNTVNDPNLGRLAIELQQLKRPSLRASMDASSMVLTDSRRAAAGRKVFVSATADGQLRTATLTRPIENDPRQRPGVGATPDFYWAFLADGVIYRAANTALNTSTPVGCAVTAYQEAPIHWPLTMDLTLPPGFVPSSADPNTAVKVTTAPGTASGLAKTATYDAGTRTYAVTVSASQDLVGQDLGSPSQVHVWVDGVFAAGAPDSAESSCHIVTTTENAEGDDIPYVTTTGTEYRLVNVFPVLSLLTTAERSPVERNGRADIDLRLENEVFDDVSGAVIPSGARAKAREAVIYYRVPQEGDYPAEERGTIAVEFEDATSPDATQVWVSAAEDPTRTSGNAMPVAGWVACGLPCDATALGLAGVAAADVRWVAFRIPEVLMTDTAPRSGAPGPGVGHLDAPYRASVGLRDLGSTGDAGQDPQIVSYAEVRSLDTATPAFGSPVPVVIAIACDADLGVGFDVPEVCDGIDNNCDGTLDPAGCDDDDDGHCEAGMPCVAGSSMCPEGCADCDDQATPIHPGAAELCNGIDDDCDAGTSAAGGEGDSDDDGALTCVDCDDTNEDIAATPAECLAGGLVYWGAMDVPGLGLRAYRCVQTTAGATPTCDAVGGVLVDYPPMCQ